MPHSNLRDGSSAFFTGCEKEANQKLVGNEVRNTRKHRAQNDTGQYEVVMVNEIVDRAA